jgi:hypothetical protein
MPVMKLLGFLLLLAGWGLVLAAIGMLTPDVPRTAFVLAGAAVELLGLGLVGRSHLLAAEGKTREEKS